jgi:LAO/AO transport system kinase
VASTGKGVAELLEAIGKHRDHAKASGSFAARRKTRARQRIRGLVEEALRARVLGTGPELLDGLVDAVTAGRSTPRAAAMALLRRVTEVKRKGVDHGDR